MVLEVEGEGGVVDEEGDEISVSLSLIKSTKRPNRLQSQWKWKKTMRRSVPSKNSLNDRNRGQQSNHDHTLRRFPLKRQKEARLLKANFTKSALNKMEGDCLRNPQHRSICTESIPWSARKSSRSDCRPLG
jgi:hypothetical protein